MTFAEQENQELIGQKVSAEDIARQQAASAAEAQAMATRKQEEADRSARLASWSPEEIRLLEKALTKFPVVSAAARVLIVYGEGTALASIAGLRGPATSLLCMPVNMPQVPERTSPLERMVLRCCVSVLSTHHAQVPVSLGRRARPSGGIRWRRTCARAQCQRSSTWPSTA